jgi:hypothetical protein
MARLPGRVERLRRGVLIALVVAGVLLLAAHP